MKKLFQKRKEKKDEERRAASKSPKRDGPYPSPYTQPYAAPGKAGQPPPLVVPVPQRPAAAPINTGTPGTTPATTPRGSVYEHTPRGSGVQYDQPRQYEQPRQPVPPPRRQNPPPQGSNLSRFTEEEFSRTVNYENHFYGQAQRRANELNSRLENLVDRIDDATGAPRTPRSGRSSRGGSNRWTPVPRAGDDTSGGEEEDWVWGSVNARQGGVQGQPQQQPAKRPPSGKKGVGMGFNGSFLWGDDPPEPAAEGVPQRARPASPAPRPRNSPHSGGKSGPEPSPPPPPAVWSPQYHLDAFHEHARPPTPTRGRTATRDAPAAKPRGPRDLQLSPGRNSAFRTSAPGSRRSLPPDGRDGGRGGRAPSPSRDPDPPLGDDSLGCLSLEGVVLSRHAADRRTARDPPPASAGGSFLSYQAIWKEFADGPEGELMTTAGWARYMQLVQKEEPAWPFEGRDAIDFESFRRHCEGPANRLFRDVRHDMTHPLSDYFIATSARTWESPGGAAASAGYERALRSGFKCVSVRVWDGPQGTPVVGTEPESAHTDAMEILLTIQKHAFALSRWPVVLDLENHCTPRQQTALAGMISDAFRGALVAPAEAAGGSALPSPERLQNRVLLRARTGGAGPVAPDLAALVVLPKAQLQEGEDDDPRRRGGRAGRDAWAGPTLTDLGLFRRVGLASVSWLFSADAAAEKAQEGIDAMVRLNRSVVSRTEPCGALEGNEEAFVPWLAGFALVGTPTSRGGRAAQLYSGYFKANMRSGYVLKPPYMRSTGEAASSSAVVRPKQPRLIRLSVIRALWISAAQHELNRTRARSGNQVTRGGPPGRGASTPDPSKLVCLWEMVGPRSDSAVYRTRFGAPHAGDEPGAYSGNGAVLEFAVYEPLVTAFRIVVTTGEEDVDAEEYVGAYALPVDCLRPGYRTVVLVSAGGQRAFEVNLHVHVQTEPSVGRRFSRSLVFPGPASAASTTRPSTPAAPAPPPPALGPQKHATDWSSEPPRSARAGYQQPFRSSLF